MQRNLGDIVADIDLLALGLALESARAGVPGGGPADELHEIPDELRRMSQRGKQQTFKLERTRGAAAGWPAAVETRLAELTRQQEMLAALAARLGAGEQAALADADPKVAALDEYRDPDLRELRDSLTARRRQLEQRLAQDRERIEATAARCRPAARGDDPNSGFDKNALDHGDVEMF